MDAMTGLESRSLGTEEYRAELAAAGLSVLREYEDAGENHYYDALKASDHPVTKSADRLETS
jgi:hypothetical protein